MHSHSLDQWTHDHVFLGAQHAHNERRTWFVVALTAAMMIGEITAGSLFGSMALLADGWHMATHAAALGIAALAYLLARRQARNAHFVFGTGKFGDLAAFSSAIILGLIAVQIAWESALRLAASRADRLWRGDRGRNARPWRQSRQRLVVARRRTTIMATVIRMVTPMTIITTTTTICAPPTFTCWRMPRPRCLRSPRLVIAMYSQWVWTDPLVGIVGSLVIASWAYGLMRDSGSVLLDVRADEDLEAVIRDRIETKGDRITDLHLWQVGPGHCAAVISVVSDNPLPPATYKRRLGGLKRLCHVTVEVERCPHVAAA